MKGRFKDSICLTFTSVLRKSGGCLAGSIKKGGMWYVNSTYLLAPYPSILNHTPKFWPHDITQGSSQASHFCAMACINSTALRQPVENNASEKKNLENQRCHNFFFYVSCLKALGCCSK